MASLRGTTGKSPMDILTFIEMDTSTAKSTPYHFAIGKLIKDVNARLHGNAAVLSSVFRNRKKAVTRNRLRHLPDVNTGRSPHCATPRNEEWPSVRGIKRFV
jgi:hypothetical protein